MENDSIVFTDEDGNEVAFSVMEQKTETMKMMVLS